jgi:hypothetical protein
LLPKWGGGVEELNHSRVFITNTVTAFHEVTVDNISRFLSGIDPVTNQPRVFAGNVSKLTQPGRTGQAMGIVTFESEKLVSILHNYRMLSGHKGASLMKDFY